MPVAFRGGRPVHPSRRTQTNHMNYEQASLSLTGQHEAQRAGVEICQWHIDGRRELSCSYLAGRRSRPDRREGCQAPCPPIFAAHYSPSVRGATAPQGRHSGERGEAPLVGAVGGKGAENGRGCVHVQRRPPARCAVLLAVTDERQRNGLRMPRSFAREVRKHVPPQ